METQTQPQVQPPQGGSSVAATDGTQLNPTAVTLAKAIRNVESNGNYNAVGDGGQSHGAYQFNKDNFKNWASEYGLDGSDMSPINQDKVAYHRINGLLQKGVPPSQVAAIWNGAKYENGQYQAINPAYVDKVKNAYQQVSQGQQQNQLSPGVPALSISKAPAQPTEPQEQGLGSQLGSRVNDASQAINDTIGGKINPLSGLIQVGGAIAGGAGDVINKGLELIPGVKQVEGLIGQGVGSLAQTTAGQSVVKAIGDFSNTHPELAKDIGAGFNIATAIPIFKGLSVVKDIAMDGIASSLKDVAQKAVVEGTSDAMSTGKILTRSFERNGGKDTIQKAIQTLGKDGVPDIIDGKYSTEASFSNVGDAISKIEDNELQPLLKKASTNRIADRIPLETYRQQAIGDAVSELKSTDPVDAYFDRIKAKYGDFPSLEQMNEAKRTVAQNISEAGFNSPTYSTDKVVRSALQKAVEDGANGLGLGDVSEINQKMGNLIKYQNMLASLDKTPVKMGLVRRLAQRAVGTAAGSVVGGLVGGGIPGEVAGGFVGNQASGLLGPKNIGGLRGSFLRSSEGLVSPTKKSLLKGLVKVGGGAVAQNAVRNQ